ncbi:hypothetical protein BFP97_04660 [Roseivirga sp. 4D4]|uniref:ATP-binding protein n=1 Tax=Roseivirga sp. 4D4 TaxID=1889784 RepID=UPI000853B703|nr:ATP-binding protein [Roseivirga sp. 4D4]OEK00843.1 hypothetical protein BFP97_04660 [Roseivirga sp. 4D4]
MTMSRLGLLVFCLFATHLTIGQEVFRLSDTLIYNDRIREIDKEAAGLAGNIRRFNNLYLREYGNLDQDLQRLIDQIEDKDSPEFKALEKIQKKTVVFQLLASREPSNQSVENILALFERYEASETNLPRLLSNIVFTAGTLLGKGAYDHAIAFYNKAISIQYTPILEENGNLISTYLNLIELYLQLEAPFLAQEVIELVDNYPYDNSEVTWTKGTYTRRFSWLKGQYFMMIGDYQSALNTIDNSKINEGGITADINAQVYFTQLNIFLKNNMPDSAFMILNRMYQLELVESEALNLRRLAGAQVYQSQSDSERAMIYLDSIQGRYFGNSHYQSHLYETQIQAYRNQNKPYEALDVYNSYQAYSDSVETSLAIFRAAALNNNLQKEEAVAELRRKTAIDNERAKRRNYLLAGVSVLLFIIVLVVVKLRAIKRRTVLEVELQKSREVALIKGNFLNNLSHEIRTPLTVISGYLDLLNKNIFNRDNAVKYIARATRNSNALVNNLNNYLLLSKLDGSIDDHKVETQKPLGNFIEELVESFEAVALQKQQKLYFKSNIKSDTSIKYAFGHLEKIISNLLNNAVKYTPARKSIHISAMISDGRLVFAVKDEGMGMDEDEVKHVFDRFYQSMRHQHVGGFGVGLALVKQLVDALNGTIDVESALNLGSQFKVSLPLTIESDDLYLQEDYEDSFQCITDQEQHAPATDSKQNRPRLLVVDDNAELMLYLTDLFKEKYDCHYAFNGKEALEAVESQQFDLIISDMKMPIMGGVELFNELRKVEKYETTPFIMLSASFTEQPEDLVSSLGITDYILKPFVPSELVARINFLLQNKMYRKQLHETSGEKLEFEGKHTDLMQKLNEVILENLGNGEFGVKELVETSGYSQSRLNQIVTEQTGLSPVKIILEIRLLKAYEIIAKSKYQTVSEVCFAVGVNSKSYFFKKFKERFGITAGDLMKKHTKDFLE